MTVGTLRIDFAVYDAHSLKDKRRVVKGFKERLANRYHVSVAEVDHLDAHRRTAVGVAMVGTDPAYVHSCLDKIVDFARRQRGLSLLDYEKVLW